jgi:hypothetical protein
MIQLPPGHIPPTAKDPLAPKLHKLIVHGNSNGHRTGSYLSLHLLMGEVDVDGGSGVVGQSDHQAGVADAGVFAVAVCARVFGRVEVGGLAG